MYKIFSRFFCTTHWCRKKEKPEKKKSSPRRGTAKAFLCAGIFSGKIFAKKLDKIIFSCYTNHCERK